METLSHKPETLENSLVDSNYCLVVPHFNHLNQLTSFLPKLERLKMPCIVIDDGSDDVVRTNLGAMLDNLEGFFLIEHRVNKGKGAAIHTASKHARKLGFTHMLQVDADGQHDLDDVSRFLDYSKRHPEQIISGVPCFDDSAPKARVYGRKITDFWVALETLSFGIKDSLCGFRIYPLDQFDAVYQKHTIGARMEFDTDILVKSVWQGIQIHFIPTNVIYLENSVSHFHYLRDNFRLIYLHVGLMLGMLVRLPKLLCWRIAGRTATTN